MKTLRIVHVVEALGGGVYTYFVNLTQVLAGRSDVELTVIFSDKRKEIDPKKISKDFHPETQLILLEMNRELNLKKDLRSCRELRKILMKINPDVVHLHSSKAGVLGRIACSAIFSSKPKLYYTPHGYSFLRKDISSLQRKFFHVIEQFTYSVFGGKTIACGDTEYQYAKKIGRATLIRNGIEFRKLQDFEPVERPGKVKLIATAGRITHARNPELFNSIALQNPEIKFLWIGDGELREQITAENIQVTGWYKNREKALEHLAKADVYLQTSSWEGLPIALLEAMALKKPILATNIIGNKDVVVPGRTGYLFNSQEEIKEFISNLDDPEQRSTFGKNAAERCGLLFDSEKNFDQLLSLYEEELSR